MACKGYTQVPQGVYMTIDLAVIDDLLKKYKTPEEILGDNGLLKQLTKAVLQRALQGEMTHHLGHEKHAAITNKNRNARNGSSAKTLKGDFGTMPIEIPRDRNGSFEPLIIGKGQTRFAEFDSKIISLYSRGMTTREIKGHLEEIYGVEVSPTLISTVTEAVMEEVKIWQNRQLDALYPIVYMDAIRIKSRENGHVVNKAVYLAIGIKLDRGVKDIFIACVDGLKGFPEAIETVFPKTQIQTCIVHMVRNSLAYVSYKTRPEVAADLKRIYQSATVGQAEMELETFAAKWDEAHPTISKSWRKNWEQIIPFFAYPADIRKVIYTTNAIESLNMSLRKVTKTRGSFPNDEAIFKLLYLAMNNITKKWTRPISDWKAAMGRFTILFEDRMPKP